MTDIYIILGVFIVGFVFAMLLAQYYKVKKERIQQINQQFQGLKGEYELISKQLGCYIQWRYKLKNAEKVFYVMLLSLGFLAYKSPYLLNFMFSEIPHVSIPAFTLAFLGFHFAGLYLDRQEKDQEKRHRKLKDQMKDTKRLLISHMDPFMVQTVKEIIKKDIRKEIEAMRNSDQGCSLKCKAINQLLTKDIDRNKVIVQELMQFKWCDTC